MASTDALQSRVRTLAQCFESESFAPPNLQVLIPAESIIYKTDTLKVTSLYTSHSLFPSDM